MDELDPGLAIRIDMLLGLLALAVVVGCFAVLAINLLIGIVCLVTVGLLAVFGAEGYRSGLA